MAEDYIEIDIETDEATLKENAFAKLETSWPEWNRQDAHMEAIMVETIAAMAAEAAEVAASVPMAVFTSVLEDLHNVFQGLGSAATSTVTFTLIDALPHRIPAGAEIDIDGWAFTVLSEVITASTTVPGVPVECQVETADANDLLGENVAPLTALVFVESVSLDTPTAGGSDPESEDEWASRGSLELQLEAKSLITARDYELMALAQPSIDRVTAIGNDATRTITVYAATEAGAPLPTTEKDALLALYTEYRQSTWAVAIADTALVTINVTYEVVIYPRELPDDVMARVEQAITAYLDPRKWGLPTPGGDDSRTQRWLKEDTVRVYKLVDVIGSLDGVNYVKALTITGSSGVGQPNGDYVMTGVMPVAQPGTIIGTAHL